MMPHDSVEIDELCVGHVRQCIFRGYDMRGVAVVVGVPRKRRGRDRTVVDPVPRSKARIRGRLSDD